MSFAECVSAKLLPDLRQPHSVIRRVRLSQTLPDPRQLHDVAQSASWPNRCPIHVSRMMLLRVRLSQTVARSMSAA